MRFFKLQELVPPEIFNIYGPNSIWFIDPRLITLADSIREYFNAPMIINTWSWGGSFTQRGFRTSSSSTLSQHLFGRAIDFSIKGISPLEVYNTILHNEILFMQHGLTTMENIEFTNTWTHCDIRHTGMNKILIVNR